MSTSAALETRDVGGRPLRFPDFEAFSLAIADYFARQDAKDKPYTMAGLARALDCSRQTLINYENRDERFMDAIKQARARVEERIEEELLSREKQVTGHIFNLKNNFGWRDTQEIEYTHSLVMFGGMQPPAIQIETVSTATSLPSPSLSLCKEELTVEGEASEVA